jgi:hypothetical protein
MKKIIFVFALVFTISITANAQDKKTINNTANNIELLQNGKATAGELAKKDAVELGQFLKLTDTEITNFIGLFENRYQTLAVKNLSAERRAILATVIEAKIRATLSPEKMKILENNEVMYEKLIK